MQQISEERKNQVIDLYFNQHKSYAEIAQIEKMSPRDIHAIIKEEEARRQKYKHHQQQELINYYEARQLALKLLANAGYGVCARKEFAYSDYRVSEIITGYGRLIHKQMEIMVLSIMVFTLCLGLQTQYLSDMMVLSILQQVLQTNVLLNFLEIVRTD